MQKKETIDELFPRWYDENSRVYEDLSKTVSVALDSLLRDSGIEFVSITARLKEKASCVDKLKRKTYTSVSEMTDLAGLRVITYLQSDVDRVGALLEKEFEVVANLSVDKDAALGVDRVGYRSKHFVCLLGKRRLGLKENKRFKSLKFEVQVRTVLQHAWAEIEHDRNYKFGGVLPVELRRRLNLVAGMLELADLEFEEITRLIGQYQRSVANKAGRGDLSEEINSLSVTEYLAKKKFFNDKLVWREGRNKGVDARVVQELTSFGVSSLAELDELFTQDFVAATQGRGATTANSLLRRAMFFADPERFFGPGQVRHFAGLVPNTYAILEERVGRAKALKLLRSAKMRRMPPAQLG